MTTTTVKDAIKLKSNAEYLRELMDMTIEAYDGTLEDAVFLGELLAKIESLRTAQHTGDDGK